MRPSTLSLLVDILTSVSRLYRVLLSLFCLYILSSLIPVVILSPMYHWLCFTADLVLAEHTCAALRKVSPQSLSDGSLLPMDHPLLALLQQILEEHFTNLSTSRWAPLAEQAIGCVYQLCVSPTSFCQAFLVAATELTFPKESVSDSGNALHDKFMYSCPSTNN